MGMQPKLAEERVNDVIQQWKIQKDVMTLFKNYWFPSEDRILIQLTKLVGAASTEEICLVGSLTASLHAALSAFYRPLEN